MLTLAPAIRRLIPEAYALGREADSLEEADEAFGALLRRHGVALDSVAAIALDEACASGLAAAGLMPYHH